DLEVDNLALEGVAPELAPSDFVSQNCETLATLMQEETKKSESPPSSDSKDSRHKRRKRVSSSSSDSSDNEDEETGHWKSRNGYRNQEDEDMSRPWRRQKVDAFTRRISDFSEDKRRRMPANVKTYDGTGDPDDHLKSLNQLPLSKTSHTPCGATCLIPRDLDDHLKIFESSATIEN
nr:reverse transcriptase domain-containing protein [Tanacetum cinerariifolium]